MILNKRRRWFHSPRVKLSLVSTSAIWFLVSSYLIWIFGSELILLSNQSSATLWVLDTCLIVGLRFLTTILITRLEKNVCWWVRDPHLTIAQHLVCSFQLVLLSWFYGWNGLLSRTSFLEQVYLVLQCCLLNVTLQLQRSKGREQVIHPFAIQHRTK